MRKHLFSFVSLFCCLILVACGEGQPTQVLGGGDGDGGNNGNNKPVTAQAPNYKPTQFLPSSWFVWEKTVGEATICQKWTFQELSAAGQKIEILNSVDCETYDRFIRETIVFVPTTGEITYHAKVSPEGTDIWGPLTGKSIAPYFYISKDSVKHLKRDATIADLRLPIFQIAGQNRFYLNAPGSPLHALAVWWQENPKTAAITQYRLVDWMLKCPKNDLNAPHLFCKH